MVAIARAGANFSDPREFLPSAVLAGGLKNGTPAAVLSASDVAGFFTNIAVAGVADNTNWTANTYKTILSISSGFGLVSHLIGPTGLAGTPTTTFEITVDGVLTEVAVAQTTTGHRSVLGPLDYAQATFTTANVIARVPDSIDASKRVATYLTTNYGVPSWTFALMLGMPCLRFRQSLLIRMKTTEANSTTTNQERQSAVQYMLQG